MLRAEVTQGLDNEPGRATCRCHVARFRASQLHRHRADPDHTARTVCKEHHPRGHLLGQAKQVRCIGARRLEPDSITPSEGLGDSIRVWRERTKSRVQFRVVVQATAELPDGAGIGLTPQRRGNGRAAGEVQEVARREHPTPPMSSDTVK